MTDELLARAARALREETAGDDTSARFTRSRVMASVLEERVKRRTRWAFLIPIAATFVAATALGAASGKTHAALEAVARALGFERDPPPPAEPRVPRARSKPLASKVGPPPALPPPLEAARSEPEPAVTPPEPAAQPGAGSARELAPPPPSAPPAPAPATSRAEVPSSDPAFELYRVAHHAHFVEHDDARALAAWNAYLQAAPNGALAPEARYNRALCLVRLHRTDEARAALRPFADGRYGAYRREEARELLDALPAALSGPHARDRSDER